MRTFLLFLLSAASMFAAGWITHTYLTTPERISLPHPFAPDEPPATPLQRYSIPDLQQATFTPSPITLKRELKRTETAVTYLFSYLTTNRNMSGALTIPTTSPPADGYPVIIMVRGYADTAGYTTGTGTKNVAGVYAEHGYVTFAPDFFGFGESDSEPTDTWEARFVKPVNVIELVASVREARSLSASGSAIPLNTTQLGLWGHSNGGQIALTTLEVLREPLPTSLWAPVTAPFPYSILFFSDTADDEGKGLRTWLAQFEQLYNVSDFTITQHIDALRGPLQIQHGSADGDALKVWSDVFAQKITQENTRRGKIIADETARAATEAASATTSGEEQAPSETILEPITFIYHEYPGADHSLRPNWNQAVQRDIEFFETQFSR